MRHFVMGQMLKHHAHPISVHFPNGLTQFGIYMNPNGWERTQTLDRYLTLSTLPKQPRRRVVIRTAEYVLKHCPGETGAHAEIRELMERV